MSQMLQAGVNDVGGTLNGENISRAAGARHGQAVDQSDFELLCQPLNRTLRQRNTLYEILEEQPKSEALRKRIPVVAE